MKQDRFLTGILIGIGVLIVVALALFFTRRQDVAYLNQDTPTAVVHDYALAVYQGDYQRAYEFLADQPNRPSYDYYRQTVITTNIKQSGADLRLGEATVEGENAFVMVAVIYPSGDPFSRTYENWEQARLVRQEGAWKLEYMPYPYWGWDWYQPAPEKTP